MRLLFDHNVPAPLRRLLPQHDVTTAGERGWGELTNGLLLSAAEREGFEMFVTSDKNLVYQQNIAARRIAILVLPTQNMSILREGLEKLVLAIDRAGQGAYLEFDLPRPALVRRPPPGQEQ